MRTIQGFIPILFVLSSASSLVGAQPIVIEDQRIERRVSYADLNLQTREGQNALNQRVKVAARQVCLESGLTPYEPVLFNGLSSCERAAFDKARPQVNDAITAQSIAMRVMASRH